MNTELDIIRDRILHSLLPDIAFDGWSWPAVEKAAVAAGYDRAMALAVFPSKLDGALDHFSDWADRAMLAKLVHTDATSLRVRDRIRVAVTARLEILQPWKEAARLASRYWSVPTRAGHAARLVWRTADQIWIWAGDVSDDYNRITKRVLLTSVITATMLAWISEKDGGMEAVLAFLDRRIENVMRLGGIIGKIKKRPARPV